MLRRALINRIFDEPQIGFIFAAEPVLLSSGVERAADAIGTLVIQTSILAR